MPKEEYTVNIGSLKVVGSAKDLHRLAHIYGLAACEYGHQVVDEIHKKHRDTIIAELEIEQQKLEKIEKHIINTIKNSAYYKAHSSKMLNLINDILEEVEHNAH